MQFFDRLRRFPGRLLGAIREGIAESLVDDETKLSQRKFDAFTKSSRSDEFVTLRVFNGTQVEILARSGWEIVTLIPGDEPSSNEYVVRVRRAVLADEFGANG